MDLKEYRAKRKDFNMNIIFFYSIGRSGTAYLYQVFGHKKWTPLDEAYPPQGNTVVVHEKWVPTNKEIQALKLIKPTSQEGLEIQKNRLDKIRSGALRRLCENVIITDSCLGRWCPYYIIKNFNYKIIFLDRDREDVIKSWKNRYREYAKRYGKTKAKDLLAQRFKYNYFNITDKYTLLHVDKEKWKKYSIGEKIGWYYDESIAKWTELKQEIPKENRFETSYEEITTIEGLTRLSNFIGLPFSYDLMNVKVNYNDYL